MTDLDRVMEIRRAEETARAQGLKQGRIEGLKEAARIVCELCQMGEVVGKNHFHPFIMSTGEVHYELCRAAIIRARIQELEGEK